MGFLKHAFTVDGSVGSMLLPPSPEQEASFDMYIAQSLASTGRFFMSWIVVMCVVLWPTDLLLMPKISTVVTTVTVLRGILLVTSCGTLLVLWRRQAVSLRAQPLFVAPWLLACAALAYCLASLGDLDTPWFHFSHLCVAFTALFPVRLGLRVMYAFAFASALFVGGVLARPSMLRSAFLPTTVGYLFTILCASVAFGQLLFLLRRSNFFQSQALQRYAADLSSQVAEQTCELRQLTASMADRIEAERAHIFRELHDELGQELTAMRYELRFTRQRFGQEPASIRGNLANLEALLLRTNRTMRALVTDLRPQMLNDIGLSASAEWLVEQAAERTRLPCALRVEGSEPRGLASEVAIAAFRVIQESLTNAARHACASRIDVAIRFLERAVEILIQDDGIGFAEHAGRCRGMGLLGMRERARALGGQFTLESAPGRGAKVHCLLPLDEAAP